MKNFITFLLSDNGWKASAINALGSAIVLVLLNSFLFSLAISLIKLALIVAIIGFSLRAAWLAYPLLKKEYEKRV